MEVWSSWSQTGGEGRGERGGGRGEGRRSGEERGGEGGRGDAALLSIAASFLHALHLKEEPFLLFVEVTAENVPEPQDHTMSGMVSSVVHRVVPEGEEEGVEGEEEGEGRRGRRGWRRGRRGRRKGSRGRRREFSNHTSTL